MSGGQPGVHEAYMASCQTALDTRLPSCVWLESLALSSYWMQSLEGKEFFTGYQKAWLLRIFCVQCCQWEVMPAFWPHKTRMWRSGNRPKRLCMKSTTTCFMDLHAKEGERVHQWNVAVALMDPGSWLISDDNRKSLVLIGTLLYVFGSCSCHSEITEEM